MVRSFFAEWHPLALACILLLARLASDELYSEFASLDITSAGVVAVFEVAIDIVFGIAIPGDNLVTKEITIINMTT
ncbi:hypothetical protein NQT74_06890 [Alteromonas stellipolaris]|jgi:hypothetical protein|uniref:hypothetical protein n=1 Tax=Alteromonas stellipolaris TaxID=233316 RepID=UPI001559F8FE|nr:hypothetical protein [Alteromonas stellipolaris]MCQ8848299.1 hypothetical protein [Alteromonas stellipolaris]